MYLLLYYSPETPLYDGQSGSIIYVLGAQDKTLYRFGMLISELRRHHKSGKNVYQGIVLRQAFDELEFKYSHVIQGLWPLGKPDNNDGTEMESLFGNQCSFFENLGLDHPCARARQSCDSGYPSEFQSNLATGVSTCAKSMSGNEHQDGDTFE